MTPKKKNKLYVPEKGDVVWINFEPQTGKEIRKRRPGLILTSKAYNRATGLCLICPMTSKKKNLPFELLYSEKPSSVIVINQLKSLDWRERRAEFKEKSPSDIVVKAIAMIGTLLTQ